MLYMVTFTINIPQMLAYIPYMDPMGDGLWPSHARARLLNGVAFCCPAANDQHSAAAFHVSDALNQYGIQTHPFFALLEAFQA